MAVNFSRRFGPTGFGTPGLSVKYDARMDGLIALTDQVTYNFRGGKFQEALARAHAEAAEKVQLGMVDRLKARVAETGRRQRGTKHLELSLLDERNAEVTATGYLVGRESWLDRSPAELYWRRIEYGDNETYDSYILFTNDFSRYYGPWSPGGFTSQSAFRSRRSGKNNLYSRKQPPGYKHMRMPQHRGAWVQNIGPYPAYRFSEGGLAVQDRLDMLDLYRRYLPASIPLESIVRKK